VPPELRSSQRSSSIDPTPVARSPGDLAPASAPSQSSEMDKSSQASVAVEWVTLAATVIVGIVGLWFANNYRRQMTLKLSQTRLDAYSRLWEMTGIAAPTRLDALGDGGQLELGERRDLWAAMTDWYYGKGGGMLLTATTKGVYLNVKHNLVCESKKLSPAGLYDKIREELNLSPGQELEELEELDKLEGKIRGTLAIRLISLLRTQLKSDLTIYGSTYSGKLAEYESFFLEKSGVKLYSKAWAIATGLSTWKRWQLRLRALIRGLQKKNPVNDQKPGRPCPSPLVENSAILSVKGTARTPPSSRIAIRNALSGENNSNDASQLRSRTHGNIQLRLGPITRPDRTLR
jgi:hypothetical protein